jgi:hypothetical protein
MKKRKKKKNRKWFNDYITFYWFLPYRYHIHTYMSAASFVLSATLSRPLMAFSAKVASELNISLFLSILSTYAYMYIYIYMHMYIQVQEEKKKNRSIYVHRNRPCMCVWIGGLFSPLFLSQLPWTNRQAAAVAAASLNVINLGRATFVRLLVLYINRSFFSYVTYCAFNNVQINL